MPTITTIISMQDAITPTLYSINNELNIVLNSFEKLKECTYKVINIANIQSARQELVSINTTIMQVEKNMKNISDESDKLPKKFDIGTNSLSGLLKKAKNIVLPDGGIAAIKNILNLSDEITNTKTRLNMIVDNGVSVEELENKIFSSAMRSRVDYMDTANMVSKVGSQTEGEFKSNDELVTFTEQLNKNFVLAGTDQQGIAETQLQLAQAFNSGRLTSEGVNVIYDNAISIIQKIADYLDVDIEKMRGMATEGKLSAEIVKNALLASVEETNNAFNKIPMTWTQIWTQIKNIVLKSFQPILNKINQLTNNTKTQKVINGVITAISALVGVVNPLLDIIITIGSFVVDNWSWIAPIVYGIVAAYLAWNIASGITTFLVWTQVLAEYALATAKGVEASATTAATMTQLGLNTAMLACPAFWIVLAILAVIAVLTYLWFTNNNVAYAMLYIWDTLKLGVMAAGIGIQATWYALQLAGMYLWLGIQTCILGMMTVWYGFQNGVDAVCTGVLYIFQGLYNGIVWIVNKIIEALNTIPGVSINTAKYTEFADDFSNKVLNDVTKRNSKLQEMINKMQGTVNQIDEMKSKFSSELSISATKIQDKAIELNTTRNERVEHRNDWTKGVESTIKEVLNMGGAGNKGDQLDNIVGDTNQIANSLDMAEEDLQSLRDIVERDVINRFTTAEIKVEMNNNNINSELDLDGIAERLGEKLEERLEIVAERSI